MTTTVADLLAVTDRRVRELIAGDQPLTPTQWDTFDDTLYQLLATLAGTIPGTQTAPQPSRATHPRIRPTISLSTKAANKAVVEAFRSYPDPLRPVRWQGQSAVESRAETELLRQQPLHIVQSQVRSSSALSGHEGAQPLGSARPRQAGPLPPPFLLLDQRPDLHPADAADPHPLSRLTVTLGALTDLLTIRDPDLAVANPSPPLSDSDRSVILRSLLTGGWVTSRYALAHLPIDHVDRPLLVAKHLAHALDGNDTPHPTRVTDTPAWSLYGAPHTDDGTPVTAAVHQLDAALDEWAIASWDALALSVPSAEVIRHINTTALHVLATVNATTPAPELTSPATSRSGTTATRLDLAGTAKAVDAAARAWAPLTTVTPPPRAYRAAAGAVNRALLRIQTLTANHQIQPDSLDHQRLLRSLTLATPAVAARLRTIDDKTGVLLGSRKLHTRVEPSEKLKYFRDHDTVHLASVTPNRVPTLAPTTHQACQRFSAFSRALCAQLSPTALAPALEPATPAIGL